MKPRCRIRDIVEQVRATDGWWLNHHRFLRRAIDPTNECPMTVDSGLSPQSYRVRARDIGMPRERAILVARAADNLVTRHRERVVRRYLLEAAALSELS